MKILKLSSLFFVLGCLLIQSCSKDFLSFKAAQNTDRNVTEQVIGQEEAILTDAPNVPPPLTRKHATKVLVHLEVQELEGTLASGVRYTFWTFGGHVPGKFIRIREADEVEFHLSNHPRNKMPHNIDLHAVSGPGGGGSASMTIPGHSSVFSFKALNPGLFVYHCATAPVAMHIANGMYGLILVEPKSGLPQVSHEYYLMQGEFYTDGSHGDPGLQPFNLKKVLDERPDYIVFNGRKESLSGENALKIKPQETVRFFIGNGGPNLISSFHIIGEIFDSVYLEGSLDSISHNVQTTLIPVGGASVVELKVNVPGTYNIVDHAMARSFNKGALAQLTAIGPESKQIYSGKIKDEIYIPISNELHASNSVTSKPVSHATTKAEKMAQGKHVFETNCAACHQDTGMGVPNAFPPLAHSDYLNHDKIRAIQKVTEGLKGKITVNGKEFDGIMPAWHLPDDEIANVLTYVYNSWGNSGQDVTTEDVKKHRTDTNSSEGS